MVWKGSASAHVTLVKRGRHHQYPIFDLATPGDPTNPQHHHGSRIFPTHAGGQESFAMSDNKSHRLYVKGKHIS